jgi:hypothetical protein
MNFYDEINLVIDALERAKQCKRDKKDYEPELLNAFCALDKILFNGEPM